MSRISVNKIANRLKTKEITVDSLINTSLRTLKPSLVLPTVRDDGSSLEVGDTVMNLTDGFKYSWSGSAWTGLELYEYKGRSLFDRLSDVVCILDAPFNAKPGGTPQKEAFDKFHDYLATNGGVGWYGPYPLNAGTHRFKRTVGVQAFKSFTVYGNSNLITLENIDPIYTPGEGQKGLSNEPYLFDLRGNAIAKIPHPTVTFKDFAIDYSAQRFKGGASEATPDLTDIDPLSTGMKLFYSEYGRVIIEGIEASNVYGEFVQLVRSPWSIIRDNVANDVSAGNIGRNDSTGAFALVLRGSATGVQITGNKATNKRVYLTDTVKGYTDRSAKNTPCGYMGIGLEYGNEVGGVPAVDYELWENAGRPSLESLVGEVSGNTMHGYYIGYKAETRVAFSMSNNNALCCWMPFVVSTRCRGVVSANFADRGYLDDLIQPMGGYRYVQGMFTHLSYTDEFQDTSDVVFDGNMCVARSIPVFTTNCNNSKFLNQMTTIMGPVAIVRAAANRPLTGLEVSGSVLVESLTASYRQTITDFLDGSFDLKVVNKTEYSYTADFNRFYSTGVYRPKVDLIAEGIVGVSFTNSTPSPFRGTFTLTDTTKAFKGDERFFAANSAIGIDAHVTVKMHSAAVPNGWPVIAYSGGGKVETDLFISDGGENKVGACVRVGAQFGYSCPTLKIRVHTDPYNNPLVSYFTRFSKSLRIDEAHGSGAVFSGNTNFGPVFMPKFYEASKLSETGSTEPNSLASLRKSTVGDGDAYYIQGMQFPYNRISQSGKEGIGCVSTGWLAPEWVASKAVVLNEYCQVKATARVYRCTVAGTTGTVAPSHTTGDAVDSTVTWSYIGPMAQFAEYGTFGTIL